MKKVQWCGCMEVRSPKDGVADSFSRELVEGKLRGEICELLEAKNMDEFKDEMSDLAWGIGRIVGGILNKPYVRIFGDGIHYRKVVSRVEEYGCMRSKRFLIEGKCPNNKGGQ